jgi:hypothetical protein
LDVDFFLKQRTAFIRNFYDAAVKGFLETQRLIETEEAPYEPPYRGEDSDGEPPFLEEWIDADTSIQIIGRTAISMLSESLKVYFNQWDELLGLGCGDSFKTEFKQRGWWNGYRKCFADKVGIDWSQCLADAELIEQIALARNTSQHGGRITSLSAEHPKDLRTKFPNPIFVAEHEKNADEDEIRALTWLGSKLVVSGEALFEAIRQVELIVDWLEPQMQKVRWGH